MTRWAMVYALCGALGAASAAASEIRMQGEVAVQSTFLPEECHSQVDAGDTLWVHYKGWLENGKLFGESKPDLPYGPFVLGRGEVIPGVDQGLRGMCLGETRILTVPPHLAYGPDGTGEGIPGNSTLKFEYKMARTYPAFGITTRDQEEDTCIEAAGKGSEVGLDYSFHYKVLEPGKADNWTLIADTFPTEKYWGPFTLDPESDMVEGLYKGIDGICLGETREVMIPPTMGYGAKGQTDYVPGHATLAFNLKLVHLKRPAFKVEVLKKPDTCSRQVVEGDHLSVHYSLYAIGGNFKKSDKPELMESTTGKEPWNLHFHTGFDMVAGLRHGLKGLCVGEKRRLLVPPALAWNEGIKDYIRPDATVVFLLELVSISDQAPESAAKEL